MTTSLRPPLTLSEARIQEELWRAQLIAANGATYGRKTPLLPVCVVAGLAIIGFSLDPTGSQLARVLFYGGVLRALCGPMLTVLVPTRLDVNRSASCFAPRLPGSVIGSPTSRPR